MFGCGRHPGPASTTVPLSPLVVTGRGRARAGRAEPLGGAAMEEAGCLHSPCGLHGAWARGGPGPAMEAAGCLHGLWGPSGPEPAMGATGCLDGPCGVHGAWGPSGAGTRGQGRPLRPAPLGSGREDSRARWAGWRWQASATATGLRGAGPGSWPSLPSGHVAGFPVIPYPTSPGCFILAPGPSLIQLLFPRGSGNLPWKLLKAIIRGGRRVRWEPPAW